MNDQKEHWNDIHKKGNIDHYSTPSLLAKELLKAIKPNSVILEIGCGAGNDSIAFAQSGHHIISTDFSDIAIVKNRQRFRKQKNLIFKTVDISLPLPFDESEFDVVYARLSLHYFTHDVTARIFSEIYRVLKHDGILCFICKSVDDPLYGKGERIEPDMYELDGHVRHFFSEAYTHSCLSGLFDVERLEKGEENFYDSLSAYIKVFARKID